MSDFPYQLIDQARGPRSEKAGIGNPGNFKCRLSRHKKGNFPTASSIRQFTQQVLHHNFMSAILPPLAREATSSSLFGEQRIISA